MEGLWDEGIGVTSYWVLGSVWGDENILQLDSSDGCTILQIKQKIVQLHTLKR